MSGLMRYANALLLVAFCVPAFAQSPWTVTEIPGLRVTAEDRILFLNDRVGWILADSHTILKTTDGGRSWVVENTNPTRPGTAMWSLSFADEKHGWAAGSTDFGQPTVWETTNGGSSWMVEESWPLGNVSGDLYDIQFVDAKHGWAVGFNGRGAVIVATTNGGHRWITQYNGAEITHLFRNVRCEDALNCFALGLDGVMVTEDGGESWHLVYFGGAPFRDIDVFGSTDAWVALGSGHLAHATLGGRLWNDVPVQAKGFPSHVRFVSNSAGWAITDKNEILMTRDGGKTWVPETIPVGLTPIAMTSTTSTLFVIANPGHLLTRPIK
jgi:photosystem II stability/assembly factor-like uncharacterized protein